MFSFSSFRFCFSLFNSLVSYTHSAGGNCVFPDFSSVVKSPYHMLAEPWVPLLPLSRWLCFMVCDSLTNVYVLPWRASPMKAGSLSHFHFCVPSTHQSARHLHPLVLPFQLCLGHLIISTYSYRPLPISIQLN